MGEILGGAVDFLLPSRAGWIADTSLVQNRKVRYLFLRIGLESSPLRCKRPVSVPTPEPRSWILLAQPCPCPPCLLAANTNKRYTVT